MNCEKNSVFNKHKHHSFWQRKWSIIITITTTTTTDDDNNDNDDFWRLETQNPVRILNLTLERKTLERE